MTDDEDAEIEFLDEDADIVQQCVQNVENLNTGNDVIPPLLIERVSTERSKVTASKRKKKFEIDDTDYDPSEDLKRNRKRKHPQYLPRPTTTRGRDVKIKKIESPENIPKSSRVISKSDLAQRKKLDIGIPDYDDPLCLPVRAVEADHKPVLKSWNKLCLEQFKRADKPLRAGNEESVSSKRTIILQNQRSDTGKIHTTIYSKICVENKNGVKKAEIIQSVIPKFREKKVLNYRLKLAKKKNFFQRIEVILTKEMNKDVENLVVYDHRDALSAVYKTIAAKSDFSHTNEEDKKYLKEMACCKICARCYQSSWRGQKKNVKKKITCDICKETTENVYKLLTHLKKHSNAEVRPYKSSLVKMIKESVGYHYKCRICQQSFPSLKSLREHINDHKGSTLFVCEVGNHVTK